MDRKSFEGNDCGQQRYYPNRFLAWLRKTTQAAGGTAGVPAEIRTEHFVHMSAQHYAYTILLGVTSVKFVLFKPASLKSLRSGGLEWHDVHTY
jgi:hypothetical protein